MSLTAVRQGENVPSADIMLVREGKIITRYGFDASIQIGHLLLKGRYGARVRLLLCGWCFWLCFGLSGKVLGVYNSCISCLLARRISS